MAVRENVEGLNRLCPVFGREISADLCYDALCCLTGSFKVDSLAELGGIEDIEAARVICKSCRYCDLD